MKNMNIIIIMPCRLWRTINTKQKNKRSKDRMTYSLHWTLAYIIQMEFCLMFQGLNLAEQYIHNLRDKSSMRTIPTCSSHGVCFPWTCLLHFKNQMFQGIRVHATDILQFILHELAGSIRYCTTWPDHMREQ